MIEREDHQIQNRMISCYISEESNSCVIFCFSPSGEIFSPSMFSFDFYLEKRQKYAEYEYIESKHSSIIESSEKNSKKITISSLFLFYELSIFCIFFAARMTLCRMSSGMMIPRLMTFSSTLQSHLVSIICMPLFSVEKIFSVWRNHCHQCFGSWLGLVSGIFPVWI